MWNSWPGRLKSNNTIAWKNKSFELCQGGSRYLEGTLSTVCPCFIWPKTVTLLGNGQTLEHVFLLVPKVVCVLQIHFFVSSSVPGSNIVCPAPGYNIVMCRYWYTDHTGFCNFPMYLRTWYRLCCERCLTSNYMYIICYRYIMYCMIWYSAWRDVKLRGGGGLITLSVKGC